MQILSLAGDMALVEDENGFERSYPLSDLVPIGALHVERVEKKDGKPKRAARSKRRASSELVIDLHFEKLVAYPKNYQPHQKLLKQLQELERALAKARRGRIPKLIVIHGYGQGRLREEVHRILERQDDLIFYDASFALYGQGATEVSFRF